MSCAFLLLSLFSAWIEDINLKPYFQHKEVLTNCCHTNEFKNACREVEKYIELVNYIFVEIFVLLLLFTISNHLD